MWYGVSKAPALAAVSVGVAMDSGTDVALETADTMLLNSHVLEPSPWSARRTLSPGATASAGNVRLEMTVEVADGRCPAMKMRRPCLSYVGGCFAV